MNELVTHNSEDAEKFEEPIAEAAQTSGLESAPLTEEQAREQLAEVWPYIDEVSTVAIEQIEKNKDLLDDQKAAAISSVVKELVDNYYPYDKRLEEVVDNRIKTRSSGLRTTINRLKTSKVLQPDRDLGEITDLTPSLAKELVSKLSNQKTVPVWVREDGLRVLYPVEHLPNIWEVPQLSLMKLREIDDRTTEILNAWVSKYVPFQSCNIALNPEVRDQYDHFLKERSQRDSNT